MRGVEILAPAGSSGALKAAVACGADAVYLGIDCLNARRNAENFTAQTLPQVVRNCHIHGVKVYLTLNTVVLEQEQPLLLKAAQAACEAGVDAVIVQDLGVAALLRRCCPKLRLNASTQMAVHNLDGVQMLEQLGFSRVVLARECSRQEIERIVQGTSLEVEVFVHGALCMSVSGQCYFSSVLGQRSGNRGLCAQPCRLIFRSCASDHALSLKDGCLISHLQELIELGVSSLKIEGRMKRPEYVAAAVSACRAARSGEQPDLERLAAVFSRSGFTDGYFTGNRDLELFGYRKKEDVTAASGVLKQLETLYTDPRQQVQKVGIRLDFSMQQGQFTDLQVQDCDGNVVCVQGELPQVALHKSTTQERAQAALQKTGGTPYWIEELNCEVGEGLMLPASAINAMRRDALIQLDELRGECKPIPFAREKAPELLTHTVARRPAMRARLYRLEQLVPELVKRAELITLPVPELLRLCSEKTPDFLDKLCIGLPRMLFEGSEQLHSQLAQLRELGILHASVGNLGSLNIALEHDLLLHAEPFFNVLNPLATQTLAEWECSDVCLSLEATLEAAKWLKSPVPTGVVAYGRLPLMTMRTCPVQVSAGCARCKEGENAITDRRGTAFYTSCAYGCAELLNTVPLYMGDRLDELRGLDFYEMWFTTERPEQVKQVLNACRRGEEWPESFTRGLLYKTIQ
ncbi:MAG: U32 family peptidase [Anaerotruncus sp.]|nr:U32 family peptidase [Anaerotruncus sp.]